MINYFLKRKIKKIRSLPPSLNDIKKSKKILFSVFTRYGDTIISLEIIKEFIIRYPEKDYLLLCPKQMMPYAKEFLPNVDCISFNKRNFIELIKIVKLLKRREFDIGFNPWSNGLDSCFLISYCNKFLFYKDFNKPKEINHYQVLRRYFNLAEKEWKISSLTLKERYPKILICPHSTDRNRNFSNKNLDRIILNLNQMYNHPEIVIASMEKFFFRDNCQAFQFKKTADSSRQFLKLMKSSSLIVCADSGPLHIAIALKKDLVAIMFSSEPEIVINTQASLAINKLL